MTEINEEIQVLEEESSKGLKEFYIQGIFMQSNIPNRNGRIYPPDILEREVNRYNTQYVMKNRNHA